MPYSNHDSVADGPYVSVVGGLDDDHPSKVDRVAILGAAVQLSSSSDLSRWI